MNNMMDKEDAMPTKREQVDSVEIADMRIDINDGLCIRLLDFCNAEIRHALDEGDLDDHAEEMLQLKQALRKSDKAVLEKHKCHLLAGIMWVAGFKTVSVDWATGWQEKEAR